MFNKKVEDKSNELAQKLNVFLKENKIQIVPAINFPIYNELPVELKLAIEVLNKHNPQYVLQIIPENKENASVK